jgi:hypothetical protein
MFSSFFKPKSIKSIESIVTKYMEPPTNYNFYKSIEQYKRPFLINNITVQLTEGGSGKGLEKHAVKINILSGLPSINSAILIFADNKSTPPTLEIQNIANNLGYAPKIYVFKKIKNSKLEDVGYVILMEYIYIKQKINTLCDIILDENKLLSVLKAYIELGAKNIIQEDINCRNIIFIFNLTTKTVTDKIIIIDDLSDIPNKEWDINIKLYYILYTISRLQFKQKPNLLTNYVDKWMQSNKNFNPPEESYHNSDEEEPEPEEEENIEFNRKADTIIQEFLLQKNGGYKIKNRRKRCKSKNKRKSCKNKRKSCKNKNK